MPNDHLLVNADDPVAPIDHEDDELEIGLTKREHFAVAALNGLLSRHGSIQAWATNYDIVTIAVQIADELIDRLNHADVGRLDPHHSKP